MKISEDGKKHLVHLSCFMDVVRSSAVLSPVIKNCAADAAYLLAEMRFGDDRRTEAAIERIAYEAKHRVAA